MKPQWDYVDGITSEELERKTEWDLALEAALKARATPFQSGFNVNTGAVTSGGNVIYGSNHEISLTEAISHGETAVIAKALDEFGLGDPIQVIAFAEDYPASIPSPCGNCRDAIRQYTDLESLVLICAHRDGGKAIVVPGKEYFFDNFSEANKEEAERILKSKGLKEALLGEKAAYDVYVNTAAMPKPLYGAAIVAGNKIFRGSYRGDGAYHSIFPISSAIESFRNRNIKSFNTDEIIVASSDHDPFVFYRDRQHAMEFADAIDYLNYKQGPLPVYLVNSETKKVRETNTDEWLPFKFSSASFGDFKQKMTKAYQKIRSE